MAKINIEIELDFVEEDMSLTDEVQEQIMSKIENTVVNRIKKDLTDKAAERIAAKIDILTDEAVNEKIKGFLEEKRTITDRYGDVVQEGVTVIDMLKEKVDGAMTKATLNEKGNLTTSSYDKKYTIFEFMSKKHIEEITMEGMEKLAKGTKADIDSIIKDKLKGAVAEHVTDFILKNGAGKLIAK